MARHIYRNEGGLLAFYKGYSAYMFAVLFWMAALPSATEMV